MQYEEILEEVIEYHKHAPIDILGIGDAKGEYNYLNLMKSTYKRTIRDIESLFTKSSLNKKILEIGSFLGAVSISLKKIGFSVYALDIPEFHKSSSLRSLYEENSIPFDGINLRNYKLPYESNFFDAIIICEVLEHLNFNPLPVLREINRTLKNGGYIYIGMPNQASISNRIKLCRGISIHNSINDFFKQFDKDGNMIVGLHWREYTLTETCQMTEKMGFEITKTYFFVEKENFKINGPLTKNIKSLIKKLLYTIPSFRPNQVLIGKKVSEPTYNFWLTDANS